MKKIDILPGKENLFYNEVGKHPIFVKFYMDGCPHCENMKQDWVDLENELLNNYTGDLTIMSVNARALNTLKSPLTNEVNGFPTIFLVERNGTKGRDFEGERTKDDMLKFLLENSNDVKKRGSMSLPMTMPTSMPMIIPMKYKKHKSRKYKTRKLKLTKKSKKSHKKNHKKRKTNKSKRSKK